MIESGRVCIELLAQKRCNEIHIIILYYKCMDEKKRVYSEMDIYIKIAGIFSDYSLILFCKVWDFFLILVKSEKP
jgi:hypothetical protein